MKIKDKPKKIISIRIQKKNIYKVKLRRQTRKIVYKM